MFCMKRKHVSWESITHKGKAVSLTLLDSTSIMLHYTLPPYTSLHCFTRRVKTNLKQNSSWLSFHTNNYQRKYFDDVLPHTGPFGDRDPLADPHIISR